MTYSDMVTLLLTFFVLLFAFSTTDISKFRLYSFQMPGLLEGARPWTSFRRNHLIGELESGWRNNASWDLMTELKPLSRLKAWENRF